jgi:hypothetical protein
MTCYNSELPIGPPGPVGPQGPQGPPGNTLGYKVYTALVSQIGTDAPTVVVLENTLDGVITFSYLSVGIYEIENTVAWDKLKTWYSITNLGDTATMVEVTPAIRYMTFEGPFYIYTLDNSLNAANGVLAYTPIEIRVYN